MNVHDAAGLGGPKELAPRTAANKVGRDTKMLVVVVDRGGAPVSKQPGLPRYSRPPFTPG